MKTDMVRIDAIDRQSALTGNLGFMRFDKKGRANKGYHRAACANCHFTRSACHQGSKQNSEKMQQSGGNHETYRICNRICRFRQFRSMGMTVKDRKQPNQNRCDGHRGLDKKNDQQAENNTRKGNSGFDERYRNTCDTEGGPKSHNQRKHNR